MLTVVVGILIGIVGILWGLYFGMRLSSKQKLARSKRQTSTLWQTYRNREEAIAELQQRLISMVGGNRQEAEKLVARARFGRYGKSESYYWYRAIQELEQRQQQSNP
jgi:uncharacterized membrane protein YgaE (UPF0421/DUF939 family)